jgi:hypothetical protein
MFANIVMVLLASFSFKEYESFRRVVDAVLDVWALVLGSVYRRCCAQSLFVRSSQPGLQPGNQHSVPGLPHYFLVVPGFEKSITSAELFYFLESNTGLLSFSLTGILTIKLTPVIGKFFKTG